MCKITINTDLSDMIGKSLCSNVVGQMTFNCMRNVIGVQLVPLLGNDVCQQIMVSFQQTSQLRSSYQKKKNILNHFLELSKMYQIAKSGGGMK